MEKTYLKAIFNNDKRNFSLEKAHSLLGSATARPAVMQPVEIEQVYQAQYPACGSHAGCHLKEVQEKIETGISQKFSPMYLWKKIKQFDGYKPEDGTDMQSIFKALKGGICKYDLLPTNYSQTLAEITDPKDITNEMDTDASPRGISSYAFCKTDVETLKTQIWLNKAVILLIRCDNGFFGRVKTIFTQRLYGHFVVAVGYDEENIIIVDSTETSYPIKHINVKYSTFIQQAGTAIDLPTEIIKELEYKRLNAINKVIELLKEKLALLKVKLGK